MKFVIEHSLAESWYVPNKITAKALGLRVDFWQGIHDLIAPDVFLIEAGRILAQAEKSGWIYFTRR